jgi:hypothetical protein
MIEEIPTSNAILIRKNRPSISYKSLEVSLLKALVFDKIQLSSANCNECVKSYIKDNLISYEGQDKIYRITDQDFKTCLLNEANLQLSKAIYNWSIYKMLVSRGLWSWAFVTLYYAQFYSISGLINLQGNAFSRPLLLESNGREKQVLFHVYPENFKEDKFYFEMRRYKPHEDLWKQYHGLYRKYRYKLERYSYLYEYDRNNEFKILELRHYINYDISFLINDFMEYLLSPEDLENFASKMEQDIFSANYSDDEHLELEYIASLRIRLLFDILHEILGSVHLNYFRDQLYLNRTTMLNKIKDETCVSRYFSEWITEK